MRGCADFSEGAVGSAGGSDIRQGQKDRAAGQMSWRSLLTLILAMAIGLAGVWPAVARSVLVATAVRVGDHGDHTRFVVDLSEGATFTVFALADPDRIVVDLPQVDWALPNQSGGGAGLVKAYRFGAFTAASSRIVLDLARPAAIANAFVLTPEFGNGWRLVIDLADTSREAFWASHNIRRSSEAAPPGGGMAAPAAPAAPTPPAVPAKPMLQAPFPPPVAQAPLPPVPPATAPGKAPAAKAAPSQPFPPPLATTPAEPQRTALALPPPKAAVGKAAEKPTIVIDPGHGGVDPGATGVSGAFEKTLTLAMAVELRDRLLATGRYKPVLTRDGDLFISLRDRIAFARAAGADLFMSLHADAIAKTEIRGLSVYTLSEQASDKEAAALAERENKADVIAGMDLSRESPEVTNILIDLAQRESMNLSARAAGQMIRELRREVTLLPKSHRFAGFAVLKAPDVPSVLVEMGYLSNPEEERQLHTQAYRAKLAVALVRAVDDFFKARKPIRR